MGQGLFPKILQIAADTLGVPAFARARHVDAHRQSAEHLGDSCVFGQRPQWCGGGRTPACRSKRASLLWLRPCSTVNRPKCSSMPGIASARGTSIEFSALCETAYKQRVPLFAQGFYRTPDIHFDFKTSRGTAVSLLRVWSGRVRSRSRWLHGTVQVDSHGHPSRRREIRSRPSSIADRSRGGFLQGVGWLTLEELLWDAKGRVSTGGASTYKLPSWSEVPEVFNVEMLERATQPGGGHGEQRRLGSRH